MTRVPHPTRPRPLLRWPLLTLSVGLLTSGVVAGTSSLPVTKRMLLATTAGEFKSSEADLDALSRAGSQQRPPHRWPRVVLGEDSLESEPSPAPLSQRLWQQHSLNAHYEMALPGTPSNEIVRLVPQHQPSLAAPPLTFGAHEQLSREDVPVTASPGATSGHERQGPPLTQGAGKIRGPYNRSKNNFMRSYSLLWSKSTAELELLTYALNTSTHIQLPSVSLLVCLRPDTFIRHSITDKQQQRVHIS
jgi:hypothetical protein